MKNRTIKYIKLVDAVGDRSLVFVKEANGLYQQLLAAIEADELVELDFMNTLMVLPRFLNAMLARLLDGRSKEEVLDRIHFTNYVGGDGR